MAAGKKTLQRTNRQVNIYPPTRPVHTAVIVLASPLRLLDSSSVNNQRCLDYKPNLRSLGGEQCSGGAATAPFRLKHHAFRSEGTRGFFLLLCSDGALSSSGPGPLPPLIKPKRAPLRHRVRSLSNQHLFQRFPERRLTRGHQPLLCMCVCFHFLELLHCGDHLSQQCDQYH